MDIRPKILVVENDVVLAVLKKLELEMLGYDVPTVVSTGEEAVQAVADFHPDLVLMDIDLNGAMDGIDAATEIRSRFESPVIFLSGSETFDETVIPQSSVFLHKPCSSEHLQKAIEQALLEDSLAKEIRRNRSDGIHDPLTGLPNEELFLEILRFHHLRNTFAVYYIEIDRFDRLYDNLGRENSDLLLKLFAARLQRLKRNGDCVARIGQHQFGFLANDVQSEQDAFDQATRIRTLVEQPFWIGTQDIYVSFSTGIALADSTSVAGDTLIADAKAALHQSSEGRTGTITFYSKQMQSDEQDRFQMEHNLRGALERGELKVYYQPIVDVSSQTIIGFEALLRWHHPQEGLLEASEIVPLAEECGLILPISKWVFEEACYQLAEWQRLFGPDLAIHVNVSVLHLHNRHLVHDIERILQETQINPATLKVEITESFIMENSPKVLTTLKELQSLGIALEIDDFGTGYSSLSYLHQFPVDALKIDRSFVERVEIDPAVGDIIEMIVKLSRRLNLEVIAEGVETHGQLHRIHDAGCRLVQGYYFSIPVNAEGATRLLEQFPLGDPGQPFAA